MRFLKRYFFVILCIGLGLVGTFPARATDPRTPEASELVDLVMLSSPNQADVVRNYSAAAKDLTYLTSDGLKVVVHKGEANLTNAEGTVLKVKPLGLHPSADTKLIDGNVIVQDDESIYVYQVLDDASVQIQSIISSTGDSHDIRYKVSLSTVFELRLLDDGGIQITGEHGSHLGFIAPPWAKNSMGQPVRTYYSLDGDTIIQHVDPQPTHTYPIIADPWLGQTMISSIARHPEKGGYRYKVNPTAFGRNAPAAARDAGWKEVRSKALAKGWSGFDRNNIKDQYLCHFDARLVTAFRSTWNLESWRPNVGYWATVRAGCNPS